MAVDAEDRAIVSLCTSHIADALPVLQLPYLDDLFPARSAVIQWISKYADQNGEMPKLKQVKRHFKDVDARQRAEPVRYCIDALRADLVMETAVAYSNKQGDAVDKSDLDGYLKLSKELVERVDDLTKPLTAQVVDADEVTAHQIATVQKFGAQAMRLIPTGIKPFDDEFGGLVPGLLYTLAALINLGKTYVALKVAESARAEGYRVGFYSLEMPSQHIADRTLCVRFKLDADQYVKKQQPEKSKQAGETREAWYERILTERQALVDKDSCSGKVYIRSADEEYITPRRIAADIKRLELDLVIVDAAQDLRDNRVSRDRTPGLYNALSEMNAVAMGDKLVPVLFTCQLDAEVEKRGLTKGNLTRIAWGQMFAQKSSVVLTMLGDRSTGDRDVRVDKTRDGTVGKPFHVRMMFPYVDIIGEEIGTGNIDFDEDEVFDSVSDLDKLLDHAEAAVDARDDDRRPDPTPPDEDPAGADSEPPETDQSSEYLQRAEKRRLNRLQRRAKRRD